MLINHPHYKDDIVKERNAWRHRQSWSTSNLRTFFKQYFYKVRVMQSVTALRFCFAAVYVFLCSLRRWLRIRAYFPVLPEVLMGGNVKYGVRVEIETCLYFLKPDVLIGSTTFLNSSCKIEPRNDLQRPNACYLCFSELGDGVRCIAIEFLILSTWVRRSTGNMHLVSGDRL